jgi:hypothetical protein
MKLETFSYRKDHGWSIRPFPALDSENTLVTVFGASRFAGDPGPLRALQAAYPKAHRVGCSTSGEIHGTLLMDDSLAVAVVRFDASTIQSAAVDIESAAGSFDAGSHLGRRLVRPGLRAIFLVSEGLNVNGTELVNGLNSTVPESVVITGGLAGDGDRFQRTWVLDGREPCSNRVVAVGLYGDRLQVGHGSKGGWDKFGPSRRVTRSRGNVLHELDGRPALGLYKDYLGERARDLPASALLFPLAISTRQDDPKVLVRTVLSVSEEDQSMTFAGDVPEGSVAQLMRANFERLIDGASSAAQGTQRTAGEPTPGPDVLSIAISCVGRRLILGERTEEEIEAAFNELPEGSRQVGFYSYGEISPFSSGRCDLHNQTMTLTTIAER